MQALPAGEAVTIACGDRRMRSARDTLLMCTHKNKHGRVVFKLGGGRRGRSCVVCFARSNDFLCYVSATLLLLVKRALGQRREPQ